MGNFGSKKFVQDKIICFRGCFCHLDEKYFLGLDFVTAPLSPLREHFFLLLFFFKLFYHLYFLTRFSLIFLSYHCFTYIFLVTILLELIFPSRSSILLAVSDQSLSFIPHLQQRSPFRITFVSSEQEFSKDLVCFFDSGSVQGPCFLFATLPMHLGQCSMKCSNVSLSSLTYLPVSLPRVILTLNHTIDSRLPL